MATSAVGGMGDPFAFVGNIAGLGNLWGLAIILACFGVGILLIKYAINQRWPACRFLLVQRDWMRFASFREDSGRVVEGNAIALALGRGAHGEVLKDFSRMLLHGAGKLSGGTYIATQVRGTLIPMKVDLDYADPIIDAEGQPVLDDEGKPMYVSRIIPEEVNNGRRVAERWVEGMRFANAQAKATEPLLMTLATNIPLAFIMMVFIIGLFAVYNNIADKIAPLVTIQADTTATLNRMIQYLDMKENRTVAINVNPSSAGG